MHFGDNVMQMVDERNNLLEGIVDFSTAAMHSCVCNTQIQHWSLSVSALTAFGVSLGLVLVLSCWEQARRQHPLNLIFLFVFTACESVLVATISSFYNTDIVLMAAGLTVGVTVCLSLYAMQTNRDFTAAGGILFSLLFALIGAGILSIFIHSKVMNIAIAGVGAAVFACYIVFDVQLMVGSGSYSISPDEYVFAAMNIYLVSADNPVVVDSWGFRFWCVSYMSAVQVSWSAQCRNTTLHYLLEQPPENVHGTAASLLGQSVLVVSKPRIHCGRRVAIVPINNRPAVACYIVIGSSSNRNHAYITVADVPCAAGHHQPVLVPAQTTTRDPGQQLSQHSNSSSSAAPAAAHNMAFGKARQMQEKWLKMRAYSCTSWPYVRCTAAASLVTRSTADEDAMVDDQHGCKYKTQVKAIWHQWLSWHSGNTHGLLSGCGQDRCVTSSVCRTWHLVDALPHAMWH